MKKVCIVLAAICMFCSMRAEAAIEKYIGESNEPVFNSMITGLTKEVINFDDLTLGEIIYDQYNPSVRFLTNDGFDIIADSTGWGTPVHSGILCANMAHDPDGLAFGELQFSQPVLGFSLWVLDVRVEGLNILIYDKEDTLLTPIFEADSGGLYTYWCIV